MENYYDYKEEIQRTISALLKLDPRTRVSFSMLLSMAYGDSRFDEVSKETFILYKKFLKECKKRNIELVFPDYNNLPIGLPFDAIFWRIEELPIKKIVFNHSYGCWGRQEKLKRNYVIFQKDKITYCTSPLENCYSSIDNCLIKISFRPDFFEYDFQNICEEVEKISRLNESVHFCDAIAPSIEIYYSNGKKRVCNGIWLDENNILLETIKKFTPNSYKKINCVEE